MTTGGTQTVTLGTANKIGLILFDGTAGQRVSLVITSSSFGSCRSGSIQILNTDGSVAGWSNLCNGSFFGAVTLPVTASYTILVSPLSTDTGSVSFTLYNVPPDPTATITAGGSPVTLATTAPGQKMSLTFSGTAGQRVSLLTTNSNFPNWYWGAVALLAPDGSQLGWSRLNSGAYIDVLILPATGTYTIAVIPSGTDIGAASFTLYNVPPDPTATITIGGPSVTLSTTTPGQNMSLTFSGTAGQRVSLLTTNSNFPNWYWGTVALLAPDGSQLGWSRLNSGAYIDALILPATGTYTIAVNPSGADIGAASFTLYNVPPDPTATITIGGPSVTLSTTTPGQNMSLTFSGTAGQRVSLLTTNSNFPNWYWGTVALLAPDGSQLGWSRLNSGAYIDALILPATGTYTIAVNPSGADIGAASFTLYNVPPDPTATITIGGPPVTVGTTTPGQNMSLTFSGTAGQRVSLLTTNSNFPNCYWGAVALLKPDGTQLAGSNLCSNAYIDALILPATGTYTMAINPSGSDNGSATFTLYNVPPDPTATITIGGPPVTLGTTTPGQKMSLTFTGTVGQQVSLLTTNSNFPNCYWGAVALLKPDGTQLAGSNLCSNAAINAVSLPLAGTYTIAVKPAGSDTGSATFTLSGQ